MVFRVLNKDSRMPFRVYALLVWIGLIEIVYGFRVWFVWILTDPNPARSRLHTVRQASTATPSTHNPKYVARAQLAINKQWVFITNTLKGIADKNK